MIKSAPKNNKDEKGFINHRGDMTEDDLMQAAKKRREKMKSKSK